jgi:hypothetical protein
MFGRTLGFAPESVVEIVDGPPAAVSLLFSASTKPRSQAQSAVCIATLVSVLGVDFSGWLSRQIHGHGLASPWKSSRRFGRARVSAEYLTGDAVLLTIEGRDWDTLSPRSA